MSEPVEVVVKPKRGEGVPVLFDEWSTCRKCLARMPFRGVKSGGTTKGLGVCCVCAEAAHRRGDPT